MTKSIVDLPPLSGASTTKATILRAAWAILLARYCDTHDVCFGASVSGRYASIPGVETMPGPMVATVPIRVQLDPEQERFEASTPNSKPGVGDGGL